MEENNTKTQADGTALFAGDAWFDPIEAGIRDRVRGFIEELIGQELDAALGRGRYERDAEAPKSYRNGTRERQLLGSFGPVALSVPRARMTAEGGGTQEWRSATLPRYARMPSVPMMMRHCLPGSLALRVLKDDLAHAHDPDPDRR